MFAIRDDDTSYWTSVEELEMVYKELYDKGYKVSFSVIPHAFESYNMSDRKTFFQTRNRKYIYENKELVDYIKHLIRLDRIEIMQHGYDHSYFHKDGKNKRFIDDKRVGLDNVFLPECIHKDIVDLSADIKKGKEILEDTFGKRVDVFVPPSNALTAKGFKVVSNLNMNVSGTMTTRFNRPMGVLSFKNYLIKAIWKFREKKIKYPYVLNYKNNKELIGYSLTPDASVESLLEQYKFCLENNADFVLATHYWEILENKELYRDFVSILKKIENSDSSYATVSEVII